VISAGRRAAAGFSLIEILITLVIVAILAVVVVPTATSRLSAGRGTALANELASIGTALRAFRTNTGTFPKNLDELTTASTASLTYCGTTDATKLAKWNGPYISRWVTGDYSGSDNYIIRNALVYTAGTPSYLAVVIDNVAADVARAAEEQIDGPFVLATSYSSGAMTYSSGTINYRIAVPTCP
jgi:general secretion pathway protein G